MAAPVPPPAHQPRKRRTIDEMLASGDPDVAAQEKKKSKKAMGGVFDSFAAIHQDATKNMQLLERKHAMAKALGLLPEPNAAGAKCLSARVCSCVCACVLTSHCARVFVRLHVCWYLSLW